MKIASHIRQLASESLVYSFFGLVNKPSALAALLMPLYTRIFTPQEYGIISLIVALTAFLNILVVAGLDNSAGRWFYDSHENTDRKSTISSWFWCQLAISLFLCYIC